MSKRCTIADVAEKAGVSKVTVSYVLSGKCKTARISDTTAARVMDVAQKLDYRPNAPARMLARKHSGAVALVFQYADYFTASSSFVAELMRGVCEGCVESGVDLMLHTRPVDEGIAEANALMDGRVDGALVLRDGDDPTLRLVLERRFPCVLFFSRAQDPDIAFVDCDNFEGGRLATRHLLELGHRRILMLKGSAGSVSSNDRFSGYRSALDQFGVEFDPALVHVVTGPSHDLGPLLDVMRRPDRPTAIFAWSDDVAFGVLRALQAIGLSVPGDVSLVGFDSTDACERCAPPLTSVRQPIVQMAREAARLLGRLIQGQDVERKGLVFSPTLDVRSSTASILPTTSKKRSQ